MVKIITPNILESSPQLQSKEESTELIEIILPIYESESDAEISRYKDSQIASVYRDVLNNKLQFYSTEENIEKYIR